ncbi:MAG: EAL domain-containing protein [Pegethrix bostrychoides GSE-TBD4-15B]|uniref:EAL domain-containing protein n=1 Tax=Pegethrix bostrychoides GSE-TBD4-15B TaxID=2839662 RepID=A0A951U573_9CYAN|nr:EAL domain-containing protein [Pegethrix bostrychoides GSE-TBD4-15B]
MLPTILLLTISYFQSIADARASLATLVNTATSEADKLLRDADQILHRLKVDLDQADQKTAASLLQRQIYSDFRFREAGIFNSKGLLTATSLGIVDPPEPVSFTKSGFDPNNPNLQILGPGRSQVMQERSVALTLLGSKSIRGIYLLVDPVILTYFLEVTPDPNLGADGFITIMTRDQRILNTANASSQTVFDQLLNPSPEQIQITQTTDDGNITIVGQINRKWALRHWFKELAIIAPITCLISGLLTHIFIRQVQRSAVLDYELKLGLAQNEFELHYQPIVDLKTRRCVGAEALIRWHHPQQGMIYPGLFIPIAEQTGFIIPMTEWIIKKVIQDRASLDAKFHNLYTSINLSPSHLDTGDVNQIIQTLEAADDPYSLNIVFEITENKLIENWETAAQDAIARLKQRGIRFAIDDFGTGYSNISYLQIFDADYLKLDQIFVKGIAQDHGSRQIVDSLIDLSNKLGLATIAEGIETEAQFHYLLERGVRYGQGWLFSRPLLLEDFQKFIQEHQSD